MIKDFWAPTASHYGEVDLLKAAAEAVVQGIAKLLSGMEIAIDGEKDVTAANHDSNSRITTASVGVPIRDVVTGEDGAVCLSEIVHDAMISHYELWKVAGVLHCDTSEGNILATSPDTILSGGLTGKDRKAFVIDFDYTCGKDRTGTPVIMQQIKEETYQREEIRIKEKHKQQFYHEVMGFINRYLQSQGHASSGVDASRRSIRMPKVKH